MNTTIYAANFNVNFLGLGLVDNAYTTFVSLLNSVADPPFSCDSKHGGYCSSVTACDAYTGLWDFSF